jgi:hypothetical protein
MVQRGSIRIQRGSIRVRRGSVRVQCGSIRVWRGSKRVRLGSIREQRGSIRLRRGSIRVRRGSIGSLSACCAMGLSSILGSAIPWRLLLLSGEVMKIQEDRPRQMKYKRMYDCDV